MKYISFSLWGDKPIYNIGAIKNAELCRKIYEDWVMVVYYNSTVPTSTINELQKLNVKLVDMSNSNLYGMFWRFLAVELPESEYCVFRDADSRVTIREKMAVDEWIKSNKSIHIMRDHPAHRIPYGANGLGILGGMWGIKSKYIDLVGMINKFVENKILSYGSDQTFLKQIYDNFKNDIITHDEFFEKKPFPIKREYGRFVGDRIDEFDKPVGSDYRAII